MVLPNASFAASVGAAESTATARLLHYHGVLELPLGSPPRGFPELLWGAGGAGGGGSRVVLLSCASLAAAVRAFLGSLFQPTLHSHFPAPQGGAAAAAAHPSSSPSFFATVQAIALVTSAPEEEEEEEERRGGGVHLLEAPTILDAFLPAAKRAVTRPPEISQAGGLVGALGVRVGGVGEIGRLCDLLSKRLIALTTASASGAGEGELGWGEVKTAAVLVTTSTGGRWLSVCSGGAGDGSGSGGGGLWRGLLAEATLRAFRERGVGEAAAAASTPFERFILCAGASGGAAALRALSLITIL